MMVYWLAIGINELMFESRREIELDSGHLLKKIDYGKMSKYKRENVGIEWETRGI